MKKSFDPALFNARVYQSGSSSAQPFKIGLERGEIILTNQEGSVVDELQGDNWNLSLGGTNDEKVILKETTLGHTIVADPQFLNVLAGGTNFPHLTDEARKLKRGDFSRSVGRSAGMIVLILMLIFFVIWVIIGFSYHGSNRTVSQTDNVSEREGHSADAMDETDGQKYVVDQHYCGIISIISNTTFILKFRITAGRNWQNDSIHILKNSIYPAIKLWS